jgi:hypothetical protein
MKNNGLTTILNWALIVGAVALCISGIKYYNQSKTSRSYRGLLAEFNQLQTAQSIVSGLVNETMEYSKAHPDINPTLEAIGLKQGAAKPAPAPAAVKPAAK